ncbi:MAG: carboxypeptidase-like regulatory domain-containing protein [Methanomassiliicoccus sp.]|nr:carboxypeptidase-like regulatory domain-containing protein [Methanomassiliicoccus sp.]
MENKKKRLILTALALASAFIVMVAALAYNPQSEATTTSKLLTIHGTVTDENGHPIENAEVIAESSSTTTNASGWYSFSYVYNFSADQKAIVAAVDHDRVRWCEVTYFDASTASSFEFNFTLDSEKNITVPLGIIVSASTIDNSTLLNLTLDKKLDIYAVQKMSGTNSIEVWMSFNNETEFNLQTVNSTSFVLCMNATVCGAYTDAGEITSLRCNQSGQIFAMPIGCDDIDYNKISSECSTLNIPYGENATVSAIQSACETDQYYRLPDSPFLSFSFDLLGKNVTIQESRIMDLSASFVFDHSNHYLISVTIEPLTAGSHTYNAYMENGCAIHIWEVAPQQGDDQ